MAHCVKETSEPQLCLSGQLPPGCGVRVQLIYPLWPLGAFFTHVCNPPKGSGSHRGRKDCLILRRRSAPTRMAGLDSSDIPYIYALYANLSSGYRNQELTSLRHAGGFRSSSSSPLQASIFTCFTYGSLTHNEISFVLLRIRHHLLPRGAVPPGQVAGQRNGKW